MPTVQANPNMVDMNPFHLVPPMNIKQEEEFADPLTPEEEEKVRLAEEEFARGEYYSKLPGETWEECFARIDADPEKWLACNLEKEQVKFV